MSSASFASKDSGVWRVGAALAGSGLDFLESREVELRGSTARTASSPSTSPEALPARLSP
jgi:hypothetical protein